MQELGALLKKERQEKGISLEEISRKTKIQLRHLQSLEKGDFSCFAGTVYIKGALRNYAEAIGINPSELVSYYERISKEALRQAEDEKESKTTLFPERERRSFPVVALIWLLLLAVVFGGSIWYRSQSNLNGQQRIPFRSVEEEPEQEEEPEITIPSPQPEHFPEVEELPELIPLSQERREAVYLFKGADKMEPVLSFTGSCWVRIEQDGVIIEEKTYNRGQTRVLPDSNETKIRFGNPPGARLEVSGLSVHDMSQIGNVFTIVIRKE